MGRQGVRLRDRALAQELGVADRVRLTGARYGQDKLAALAAADLFVLPSTFESYGNAAAEAVAAALPVLLSDGCGIAPLIHGRAGLAVPPTVEGLGMGLAALLGDEPRRAALTRGRADVITQLSWDEPLRQLEGYYRHAVWPATQPTPAP
ncbi:MAG: glycosyltransferase [Caldilineaceae bacterium]|nr:glycosyltransferase [Caldilineaceae bacterium]